MSSLAPNLDPDARAIFSPREFRMLNHLRLVAMDCRTSAYLDFDRACMMLHHDPKRSGDAHARGLLRSFAQVFEGRTVFYRPGTEETSFSEAWLLRSLIAVQQGDVSSPEFLLARKIPRHARRGMLFLMHGIVSNWPTQGVGISASD